MIKVGAPGQKVFGRRKTQGLGAWGNSREGFGSEGLTFGQEPETRGLVELDKGAGVEPLHHRRNRIESLRYRVYRSPSRASGPRRLGRLGEGFGSEGLTCGQEPETRGLVELR